MKAYHITALVIYFTGVTLGASIGFFASTLILVLYFACKKLWNNKRDAEELESATNYV